MRRSLLLLVPLVALLGGLVTAGGPAASAAPDRPVHIVLLDEAPLAVYRGGTAGLAPTDPAVTGAPRLDAESAPARGYRAHLRARQDAVLGAAAVLVGRTLEPLFRYGRAATLEQSVREGDTRAPSRAHGLHRVSIRSGRGASNTSSTAAGTAGTFRDIDARQRNAGEQAGVRR